MLNAKITSLGCFLPPKVLTNEELSRTVGITEDWIVERTGIRERRIAGPTVATSDMAVAAARATLAQRGIAAPELDAIIVCTVTPDMQFPATACLVQDQLGATGCWGFDLAAASTGFLYGMTTAAHLVSCGTHRKVLLIGADTMSRITDPTDRTTCILFGDGAGAFLIEQAEPGEHGYIGHKSELDGSGARLLSLPGGGSRMPASVESVARRQHYVKQEGPQVFKFAVRKTYELCRSLLNEHGLSVKDVHLLIPHQANRRIIAATAARLSLPEERVVVDLEKFGNTTAATIPLATRDAVMSGRLKKGDLVLFSAIGAGFTAGAILWRWGY